MSPLRRVCAVLVLLPALAWPLAACSTTVVSEAPAPAPGAPADPGPPAPVSLKTCAIGTMVSEGGAACVAVGPTQVPDGFVSAGDDWGFRAVNPFGLCPDRFFSPIGSKICVGIDVACPTSFVPAGATLVHDQTELEAALATSAPTIALEDGTYDPIVVSRDVAIVGRCPDRAFLRGAGATGTGRAIEVQGAHTVSLRSVTVGDAGFAIWASDNAKISVERTLFAGNGAAAWIQRGASLTVWHALVKAADVTMADGVLVGDGGHADLSEMELRDMHVAVAAFGAGSTVTGSQLVVSDRSPEPLSAVIVASHGGSVTVDRSLLFANDTFIGGSVDTDARETGSLPATLRITNSDLMRVHPTDAGGFDVAGGSTLELVNDTFETRARVAISAEQAANVSLERTVIRPVLPTDPATRGVGAGLVINDGVRLALDRSAILGVAQSAIMASRGCHIRVAGSLIGDEWEYARKDFDTRFDSGQAISLSGDASLDLSDSALVDNAGAAIWMDRGGQASVRLQRALIVATRPAARSTAAVGLLAWSGTVDVRDSLVHAMGGTALAFGTVTGAVAGTTLSDSDVAYRFMKGGHSDAATTDDQRPNAGQLLTRGDILVGMSSAETTDPLPLGDCRCATPAAAP